MANLGTNFDASKVDPNGGFPVIPFGKYIAHIIASDMKPTKDGGGQYLELDIVVIEGPQQGRHVFDRLNLYNRNDQTVQIAQRTLSQICHAVGVMSVTDSEELHARRMMIDVRIEEGKGQYRDQNRVVAYLPADGSALAFAGTAGAAQTSAAQASRAAAAPASRTGTAPPWRNRAQTQA